MKYLKLIPVLAILVACASPPARATGTQFWEIGTFQGFLQGNLDGVSASVNGMLMLAPSTQPVFTPNETVALSVAADGHGDLYVGTGHQGKVFVVNGQGTGRVLFQAPEPEILALAVGPDGNLYVASSPEGKIYRVTQEGKSSVFYNPKVKYIWALAFDSHGNLYAGTGDRGEIFRIDPDGKGSVFFASNQTHIMCLAFDHQGNLLAGSDPNGLVYRITPQGKAFVLYQASLPEIHALATGQDGRIYVAALGSAAGGAPGYFPGQGGRAPMISPVRTTVTVVASNGGSDSTDPADSRVSLVHPTSPSAPIAPGGAYYPNRGSGRGALVELSPDYTAQTLWSSSRGSIFGLAARGGHVIFSTDDDGRIFELTPSPAGSGLTLLTETRESLPTRILAAENGLFVATSNVAKLIRIGHGFAPNGVYVSPVKDARFSSQWGRISWQATAPAGSSLQFFTRSGNSARPDNTWSAWTGPYTNPEGSSIESTPARYLQWKAVFHGSGDASPSLSDVQVSYLNQNLPPEIRSLTINDGNEKLEMAGTPLVTPAGPINMSPVSTVGSPAAVSLEYESQPAPADPSGKRPVVISWRATDPNHDHLVYSLYIKSRSEQSWHLLQDKLRASEFSLPTDALPDGSYRVRLVASDSPSNPPDKALTASLESAPFWVDNTPPVVRLTGKDVRGQTAVVRFKAESKAAPLDRAQFSEGENRWKDVVSDDGIVDSQQESFTIHLDSLTPGEHVISLRAFDTSGNVGVGSAVIQVQ